MPRTLPFAFFLNVVACSSGGGTAAPAEAGLRDSSADARSTSPTDGRSREASTEASISQKGDASIPDARDVDTSTGSVRATLGGCPLFAAGYAYNQDVSQSSVDPSSATYVASLDSLAPSIAAEFPGGEYYNIVPSSQPLVPVATASAYGFLSDGGFFYDTDAALAAASAAIPSGVVYENMTTPNADHHMMVLQQGVCLLYELYASNPSSATTGWDVMVTWNLNGGPQIPASLDIGSTTQAGTPLLPGIIWPAEIASGEIRHAIDIVMADNAITPCAYVHPASTVRYSGAPSGGGIPYGARLRLKASYDVSGYTGTQALVVLRALQKYGMFNTDASGESRSVFRLGQDADGGTLDQADMGQLDQLTWDDFDVMPLGTVLTDTGCTP
jgi:hypothetical protein